MERVDVWRGRMGMWRGGKEETHGEGCWEYEEVERGWKEGMCGEGEWGCVEENGDVRWRKEVMYRKGGWGCEKVERGNAWRGMRGGEGGVWKARTGAKREVGVVRRWSGAR